MMYYGLRQSTINLINSIFIQYPGIESVIIYGSRAKGNYRSGSDIDLTIKGKGISLNELFRIENDLDDLLLPYEIDLSLYDQINNTDLIDLINRLGSVFYSK